MNLRSLAFLPLVFLGAAAAPQTDCGATLGGGYQAVPAPPDPAGRSVPSAGLGGSVFAALPTTEVDAGCRSPLPMSGQSGTLRSDSADILHGLPTPELMRRIDEPKRSPYYQ
jgi:hypothetical protein